MMASETDFVSRDLPYYSPFDRPNWKRKSKKTWLSGGLPAARRCRRYRCRFAGRRLEPPLQVTTCGEDRHIARCPGGSCRSEGPRLRPGRPLPRGAGGREASEGLGTWGPLADEVAGVGEERPEAVEPARGPADLDRL